MELDGRRENQTFFSISGPAPSTGSEEEVVQNGGELERPVALNTVARALDADHRGRGLAPQELGHVVIVDDGPRQAAHEEDGDGDGGDGLPPVAEVGVARSGVPDAPGSGSVRKRA